MILNRNLGRYVKPLVSILLVACLGYFAALIGLKLLDLAEPDEVRVLPTAADNGRKESNGEKISAQKIAELHIFGDAAKKKQARKKPKKVKAIKVAPRTKLKLNLTGILLPTENDEGYAMIKNRARKSAIGVYRIGDKVVGNSVLKELYVDHVIIRHNGRNESLWLTRNKQGWKGVSFEFSDDSTGENRSLKDYLPKTKLSSGERDTGQQSQQSKSTSSGENQKKSQPSSSSSSASADASDESDGSAVTEATEEMEQLRQELGELNQEVIRDLRPSFRPYVVKGRLQGYLVSRYGQYRDLLLAHGLRIGDIITKVNNIPMTHSVRKQLIANKDQLIEAGSLDLQVLRGGRELPMTLRF